MLNRRLVSTLCFLILALLAIQPVLAQECSACPPLPIITGVRWTSYNTLVWDQPADLSNIYGYYFNYRYSINGVTTGWNSSLVSPATTTSYTVGGLQPDTTPWIQAYVYATPTDPDVNRRSPVAQSSSACFGPCPEPVHPRINWFPPESGPGRLVLDHRLNRHAAAPLAMYRNPAGEGLELWAVVSASLGMPLVEVPEIAALAETGRPGGELARMSHPDSDKPVVVTWLPGTEQLEVSTYYADVPPYQINKPYVYRIDRDDRVTIVAW